MEKYGNTPKLSPNALICSAETQRFSLPLWRTLLLLCGIQSHCSNFHHNAATGEFLPEPKQHFTAQSLSYSPFSHPDMTEMLLKERWNPYSSIHPSYHHSNFVEWLFFFFFRDIICTPFVTSVCPTNLSHVMRKPAYVKCEQERCRSACASAQSDQRLYCSLPRQYNRYTCYIQTFKTLVSFCHWVGRFES